MVLPVEEESSWLPTGKCCPVQVCLWSLSNCSTPIMLWCGTPSILLGKVGAMSGLCGLTRNWPDIPDRNLLLWLLVFNFWPFFAVSGELVFSLHNLFTCFFSLPDSCTESEVALGLFFDFSLLCWRCTLSSKAFKGRKHVSCTCGTLFRWSNIHSRHEQHLSWIKGSCLQVKTDVEGKWQWIFG